MSTLLITYPLPTGKTLEIAQGDLTKEPVDAIVNAANDQLNHGGGIAAAIARAGGKTITQESAAWIRKHGAVSHASPAITSGGKLPCRYIIHAVGPRMGEGDEDRKLAEAITGSLNRAGELGLKSIAFPAISTGIFGFPKDRAARIFFQAIPVYFADHPQSPLQQVRLTLWDEETVQTFLAAAQNALGRA